MTNSFCDIALINCWELTHFDLCYAEMVVKIVVKIVSISVMEIGLHVVVIVCEYNSFTAHIFVPKWHAFADLILRLDV
jgi:hypothetical protein